MTIWNERYSSEDFLFGKEPNRFFKEQLDHLKPGKILLPAEGEGRNAVYAAKLGWEVYAFDASGVGQDKALQLAEQEGVSINYEIGLIENFEPESDAYDAIALIYCHLQPGIRTQFFEKLAASLAPEGVILLEGFRKEQIGMHSGGPRDVEMLFSEELLSEEFRMLAPLELSSESIWLDEGLGHQGEARVVRMIGRR